MKLKENQKVYICGGKNFEEGKRVIAELERRGGVNRTNLRGIGNICYIRPNGEIDCAYDAEGRIAELVKEYYTEVKVNEWPRIGEIFFYLNEEMKATRMRNVDSLFCKHVINSGNCFHSLSEAEEVAKEFREIVKWHKQLKKQRNGRPERRTGNDER